jgi:hypothetical protein
MDEKNDSTSSLEHESDEETRCLRRLRKEDPTLTAITLSEEMFNEDTGNETLVEWMSALQNNRIVKEIEFEFDSYDDDAYDYSPLLNMIRTRSQ